MFDSTDFQICRQDIWDGLPALLGKIIDTIFSITRLHCLILVGGKTPAEKTVFYSYCSFENATVFLS
jgi:hypothetical protein